MQIWSRPTVYIASVCIFIGCILIWFLSTTMAPEILVSYRTEPKLEFQFSIRRVTEVSYISLVSTSKNEYLWHIECPAGFRPKTIEYSVKPKGSIQLFPYKGAQPRKIMKGENVVLLVYYRYRYSYDLAATDNAYSFQFRPATRFVAIKKGFPKNAHLPMFPKKSE